MTLIFCISHYIYDIILYNNDFEAYFSEWDKFQIKSAFMLHLAAVFSIGFLLYFQLKINVVNLTTIEHHIEGIKRRNPFDKGDWKANFRTIFGDNTKSWFLPVRPVFTHKKYYDELDDNL